MELVLVRERVIEDATIGRLEVDGAFECHVLEDREREEKIKGKTCIPVGDYAVTLEPSPRLSKQYEAMGFGPLLPRLQAVKGFTGILIHIGNVPGDTDGCILVGTWEESFGPSVRSSRIAYGALLKKLKKAKDGISLSVRRAPGLPPPL